MIRPAIPIPQAEVDARFMAAALAYGRRNLGLVAPNPSVGALVVRDGVILGCGATYAGGRPHAETMALADAGANVRGATLYVTLEPCSHTGNTGPCADALIAAGIVRVVSAMEDPDSRVAGRGHARLRAAGIELAVGVAGEQALRANLGHVLRVTQNRPMVTLKLSETRDGYAAGDQHDPRLMITGAAANARTHMERAQHDAIMVGIGTILADDPLMNVRLPGLEARRPVRIVLDTHLRIPLGSRLVATARDYPTWIFTGDAPDPDKMQALQGRGLEILPVAIGADGHLALGSALQTMAQRGLTRIFSEGGPSIAAALIAAGLADECLLFTRTTPLGRPGVEALSVPAREKLNDPVRYHLTHDGFAGPDRIRVYQRKLG